MLKHFFSTSRASINPDSSHAAMMKPQPIEDTDPQQSVKLANEQGKIRLSGQSKANLSTRYQLGNNSNLNDRGVYASVGMDLCQFNSPTNVVQDDKQINQLKMHLYQQQRLHYVERRLRRTLSFGTIAGTVVIDTATLFEANQVALLRHNIATNTCQQVARYCQNQTTAWQAQVSLSQSEFPDILNQLWHGKIVHIASGYASSSLAVLSGPVVSAADVSASEQRQWLSQCPGTWLLVPIHKLPTHFSTSLSVSTATATSVEEETGCWGLLALSLPQQEAWTPASVSAVQGIAIELAVALQQSQLYHELVVENQELQKLALADGLTSLANRRRFDQHLVNEWQRLARDQQPLSLILCDLDHFKLYNDTFGHPAGDRCLIRVARTLLSCPQRPADLVARYGGEEFAIILPNTDTQGAWRIAQKIHNGIRALKVNHAPSHSEAYVTVTMGISTIIPGHSNSPKMLVQASDLALYYAKQQGRNRTYINGHYNTVKTDTINGAHADDGGLDIMPAES